MNTIGVYNPYGLIQKAGKRKTKSQKRYKNKSRKVRHLKTRKNRK